MIRFFQDLMDRYVQSATELTDADSRPSHL